MGNLQRWLWAKLRAAPIAPLIGVALLCYAAPLAAQEREEPRFYARAPIAPEARRHISVALLGGYGWTLNPQSIDQLNAFGVGFGVRGGFNIDAFYTGVRLQFFMGDSRVMANGELTFDETMLALEFGYDVSVDVLTLRPHLGVGLAMSSAELAAASGVTEDRSSDDLYVVGGLSVIGDLTRRLFVGLDAQFPLIVRSPMVDGFTLQLAVGLRL